MTEHDPAPRGHTVQGLSTMHTEGVDTSPVYLRCEQLNELPADVLTGLHVVPPLEACGRHGR
jgi:hypothetical protein